MVYRVTMREDVSISSTFRVRANSGGGLDDLRRLSATALQETCEALLFDGNMLVAIADRCGRVQALQWLALGGPLSLLQAPVTSGHDVDLDIEGDGYFSHQHGGYFVYLGRVFLISRGGKLVVTEVELVPADAVEVEDPGPVALIAGDLIERYVRDQHSEG